MLEVELDILSGMPNPSWMLTKPQERTLMRASPYRSKAMHIGDSSTENLGLGYRGLIVRRTKPDEDSPRNSKAAEQASA